jgi:hypothetical protein
MHEDIELETAQRQLPASPVSCCNKLSYVGLALAVPGSPRSKDRTHRGSISSEESTELQRHEASGHPLSKIDRPSVNNREKSCMGSSKMALLRSLQDF